MKKALVLLMAVLLGGFAYGWGWVHRPYQGYGGQTVLEIPAGHGSEQIVETLHEAGIIQYRYPAMVYLYLSPYRGRLQAGEYAFNGPMSPEDVFAKLARGEVRLYSFTVPEGLRVAQIAERWEESGFGERSAFIEAAQAALPEIREMVPAAVSPEGYLFPETYSFPKGILPGEAVGTMLEAFRGTVRRLEEAVPPEDWPLDLSGTVILASLIESEAAVADERALVSSVFLNRLRIGMRLECDPTVIYALIREGSYRGRLLRADLQFDSPYNTYLYSELPPGPIANPGYHSLLAAVQPAETGYLYFVRTDGGRHTFSETLAAHNRAVAEYRRGVN